MTTTEDECKKILNFLKKTKEVSPTEAGLFLGHSYYESCNRGYRILNKLVDEGKAKNLGNGRYTLND